ncbi:hypothetical protein [Massilia sp. CF038]|uniref:hypothetical protein n=1 Tax=Massilia sp. CF038 TaxID=1881045 RepID=UPI000914390F|nr:hypothetical protein [Massilia sp. CF038]SHH67868.1 hypothetical protein SAMN05428948_4915 [Massilia sp. CF038]
MIHVFDAYIDSMNEIIDPLNIHTRETASPAGPLLLRSTIDSASIGRLEEALTDLFYGRLLEDRRRRFGRAEGLIRTQPKIVLWLSVTGILVALGLAMTGGLPYQGYRLELLFALFFAATGMLSFLLTRCHRWLITPSPSFWRSIAKKLARNLLKAAREAAPFDAEYTLDGDSVTYFRTVNGVKKVAWQRPLRGRRVSGAGFTLLLNDERAIAPSLIILHQPSAEMDAWLDRHGCFAPSVEQV